MKLKKGDKVEVMKKNESSISWRVAKKLSSDGRTYRVQHDSYPCMAREQAVEMISRKLVRPGPPPVQGVKNVTSRDIVEVFYKCAWRMGAVLMVLQGKNGTKDQYLVRLLGCSREIVVDVSSIRMRQIWHDVKLDPIGKSSRKVEDVIASNLSTSIYHQKMNVRTPQTNLKSEKKHRDDYANAQDEASRSLKRMTPYGSSIIEAHNSHAGKLRIVEKDGRKQKQKVDDVSYPREILGEKHTQASLNSSDSDACSVGSCSVTGGSKNNFCIPFIPFSCRDSDAVSSDVESCFGSGSERKNSYFLLQEEVEGSIRRLELNAYRRTLEALYACGPLSWEQEALLTNLRIMLNISNDEHLMELKNVISTKTAINFR